MPLLLKRLHFLLFCFGKDLRSQARGSYQSLVRIWMQPLVNAGLLLLMLRGFKHLSFDELLQSELASRILMGVFCHALMSQGYYGVSTRVMQEWQARSFSWVWLSSVPKGWMFLGWMVFEAVRAALLAGVFGVLVHFNFPSLSGFFILGVALMGGLFFVLGLSLGSARALWMLFSKAHAEVFDYLYMAFALGSCFYFPLSYFPPSIHFLLQLSPAYQGFEFLGGLVQQEVMLGHLGWALGGLCVVSLFTLQAFLLLEIPLKDKVMV